jgi:hypothetical protein
MKRPPANLARSIYGNVLATSLVVAFSEDNDYSTTQIAVSVLVTGLVFWIAHVYSSLIAERYAAGRRLTRAEVGAEFYGEWPVVQALFPPVGVLLLGTIGLLSQTRRSTSPSRVAWPPWSSGASRSGARSGCLRSTRRYDALERPVRRGGRST